MRTINLDKATLKALVRRVENLYTESARAAELDAGFDAGEWSSAAHDDMLELSVEAVLARFAEPERAVIDRALGIVQNEGHAPLFRYTRVLAQAGVAA